MMKWVHNVQVFCPKEQEGIISTTAESHLRPCLESFTFVLFYLFILKLDAFKIVQKDQSLVNPAPWQIQVGFKKG